MSSIAKKIQEQQQAEQQRTVQTVIVHKAKISFGEVVLLCALAIAIALAGVKIVSNQTAIYETNKSIQQVEAKIDEQVKVNNDLKVEVSELSTYERIWKKAAENGLMLNENNVKVVEE
ncbi:cell division protein FtsL [Peribacillus glennii]|uniref:Cell division protein FtsL n=1 Tax=Peribacillus glennii TaxID=2303991 RepID=A0A372LBU9_9BACI|nr:cell division protein FtsL [Peribacillus glennii]RFU63374.1 cell division protein FtsL [Peribacillus glennii]